MTVTVDPQNFKQNISKYLPNVDINVNKDVFDT